MKLYKEKLREKNEIEKRLLQNLEDIKSQIGTVSNNELLNKMNQELVEATQLISGEDSPSIYLGITGTVNWLAENTLLIEGARKAIEVEWDTKRHQELAKFPIISLEKIDTDSWAKADQFERAYKLVFILNTTPHSLWRDAFLDHHLHSLYSGKRETYFQGNKLVMIVADSDNLQEHAKYAKQLVDEANKIFTDRVIPAIVRDFEQQKRKALEEFDTLQNLKAKTKNIKL